MSDESNMETPRVSKSYRRKTVVGHVDRNRGVFMISVAAELAEMHPQTLRMYETKGLITPKRSPKNTRLYSQGDVERLKRIQRLTSEEGLNLAGVETVLELEEKLEKMRGELDRFRRRAEELEHEMEVEIDRARQSLRGELVPYGAYDVLGPAEEAAEEAEDEQGHGEPEPSTGARRATGTVRIPVQRPDKHR